MGSIAIWALSIWKQCISKSGFPKPIYFNTFLSPNPSSNAGCPKAMHRTRLGGLADIFVEPEEHADVVEEVIEVLHNKN